MTHENDLSRFVAAQEHEYDDALREIRGGRKTSHWMWYIFPQLRGLGFSEMATYYGLQDLAEAKAYLAHPVLGKRLREICHALLSLQDPNPDVVFGYPDNLKLCSSMTLFEQVAEGNDSVFSQVLDSCFQGRRDQRTLSMLSGKT